jgi:hypothetical protein
MKRFVMVGLGIVFSSLCVSPDVAPPIEGNGSHYVNREIVITNTSTLGDTVLLVGTHNGETFVVAENQGMGDYVQLIAVPRAKLDSAGGVQNLDFSNVADTSVPLQTLFARSYRLSSDYSLTSETFYYGIDSVRNGTIVLKLYKRVLGYNDGGADETIAY